MTSYERRKETLAWINENTSLGVCMLNTDEHFLDTDMIETLKKTHIVEPKKSGTSLILLLRERTDQSDHTVKMDLGERHFCVSATTEELKARRLATSRNYVFNELDCMIADNRCSCEFNLLEQYFDKEVILELERTGNYSIMAQLDDEARRIVIAIKSDSFIDVKK
jgi:hypothetical protein